MRISLIGAGDIEYHYFKLLKLSEKEFHNEIKKIAKVLAKHAEIVLLPDRGICFEIAKLYKKFNGEKVIATVPLSDKDFGIEHLRKYIEAEIEGKKVFDEIIDTENWYKQDLTCCLYADYILMLGISTGSLGELAYAFYLYKLFSGKKPEVKATKEKIHKEIKAGSKIPFGIIVYKPFIKEKLPYELEQYIKNFGCEIIYVDNIKELEKIMNKLAKKYQSS